MLQHVGIPIRQPIRCAICSRPLTQHEKYAGTICSDWRCKARQLDDNLRANRAKAAEALGVAPAGAFPIAVVPWRAVRIVELPAERRRALEEFLAELVSTIPAAPAAPEAVAEHAPTMPADPESDALLAKVCAVCQGFCCFYGATRRAFLDGETMRRFRLGHPEAQGDDIVAEYLRYLPQQHCEGSCAYHAPTGCTLPRAMRANICNTYECRGLKDARRGCVESVPARAYVVVRDDNRIVGGAFVDASGIRRYGAVR